MKHSEREEKRMKMRRLSLSVVFGVCVLFPAVGQSEKGDYGLGMEQSPERLVESVRAATPSGEYISAAGSGDDSPNTVGSDKKSSSSGGADNGASTAKTLRAGADSVDLSDKMPEPGYQGRIGSCGAWATAYALKSYQENVERKWGLEHNSHIFSPSFLYNIFSEGRDRGSHFPGLFSILENKGCASLEVMPYTQNVGKMPSDEAVREAKDYRIEAFSRIDPKNITAIKEVLREGHPVVFGAMLYRDFVRYEGGVYRRSSSAKYGGHGMTLVGYDEARSAFKLINSWGRRWGEDGYAWIHYETFRETVFEAYKVDDVVTAAVETSRPPSPVVASEGSYLDRVEVSWSPAGNPAYFEVFRSDNGSGELEKVATVRGTVYKDSSALPGVDYLYGVKSVFVADGGDERRSEISSVARGRRAEEKTPPGSPKGLTAEKVGEGRMKVRLSWSPVDTADSYRVYRFAESKDNYVKVGKSGDNEYEDTSLEELSEKTSSAHYVVTAVNSNGEGEATRAVSVDITREREKGLPAPKRLVIEKVPGFSAPLLRWSGVEGAMKYEIQRLEENTERWAKVDTSYSDRWKIEKPDKVASYRVVALRQSQRGYPSRAVVSGDFSVRAGFDDEEYRGEKLDESKRKETFDDKDDSRFSKAERTEYGGEWESPDLFDFEKIQAFFEEARKAEKEAFRKYRKNEEQSFQEFLEKERRYDE